MPVLRKVFFLNFLLLLQSLYGFDPRITGKEVGFDFRGEYNRSLLNSIDFAGTGALELNELYTFKGGLSMGSTGDSFDIKIFTQGKIGPLFNILHFSFAYIYNGLPAYEYQTHTLLPFVSVYGRWAGISFGPAFRFSRFFGETTLHESMWSFSGYVNFINTDKMVIGIKVANFSDFYVGNMGSYSYRFYSLIHINDQWSIINDIELMQSGSVGLSASFYGIAYRGGFRFTW